jgi:hypothetical protein
MYISKKTAASLVGGGLSMSKISRMATRLKQVAGTVSDTNRNRKVDNFELANAVKDAGLGAKAKTAMWSVMGTTAADNTDGETGFQSPITKTDLKSTITGAKSELKPLARNGELTVDGLEGQRLSNVAVRLVAAAKAGG